MHSSERLAALEDVTAFAAMARPAVLGWQCRCTMLLLSSMSCRLASCLQTERTKHTSAECGWVTETLIKLEACLQEGWACHKAFAQTLACCNTCHSTAACTTLTLCRTTQLQSSECQQLPCSSICCNCRPSFARCCSAPVGQ
jgi:hypothetical protein